MSKYDYDYIIIGAGAAGCSAAKSLAKKKKRVAIIERNQWGGSSACTRDVPYSASLNFSHLYARAMYGARFGISSATLRYNYPTSLHWREKATARAVAQAKKELEELKIDLIQGQAHFLDPHKVSVKTDEGHTLSAHKFLIATGAAPHISGITGVETANCYDANTALKMRRVPKSVMVVGAGATGCELAQYFAELGSKVILVEIAERILPREDKESGEVLSEYFSKRFDIKIVPMSRVIAVEQDALGVKTFLIQAGQEKMTRVEAVVLATGSRPELDLGLENAGVKFDQHGIKVNKTLQTSQKHIFAAGDVLAGDCSTEKAEYQGGIAVMNMTGRAANYVNYDGFIRVTDTDPQIAVVGLTEDDLVKRGRKYRSTVIPLSRVIPANTQDFRMGFIKMIAGADGKILGAAMMAPDASTAIQEVAVMIRHNFSILEIASTPHPAMSWSELVRQAARELAMNK